LLCVDDVGLFAFIGNISICYTAKMKDSIIVLIEGLDAHLAGQLTLEQIDQLHISPMIVQNQMGVFPEDIQALLYELDTWDAEELARSDIERIKSELKAYIDQDSFSV
jgi:DNA-directed RNA polymerase